jgi:hypothetical protein
MTRSRAALPHLLLSLAVLAVCAGMVMFAWYPYPFLILTHSGALAAALIIAVSLAAPALTWLIATPGKDKPKLLFDLVVIGLIQVSAVAWGMYNLSEQKPYFMVFAVDRFDVLARGQVFGRIDDATFLDKPFSGPIMRYAEMPATESTAYQRLLQEVMFEGKPDIQFRPEFWSPYGERKHLALQAARPLADLRAERPESADCIDGLTGEHSTDIAQLRFVPAMMGDGYFAVVLDGGSGGVVGYIKTDPWLE